MPAVSPPFEFLGTIRVPHDRDIYSSLEYNPSLAVATIAVATSTVHSQW